MGVSLGTLLVLTLLFSFHALRAGNAVEVNSVDGLNKEAVQLLHEQKERIDLLEAALRAISLTLIKQNNNKVFASIVGDLKKDPHVSSLLSSASDAKTTLPKSKPLSSKETTETPGHQNYTNTAVSKTKWALKCSQPELFDINSIEKPEITSSSITALLNQSDNSVTVSWKPPSDCVKYVSGLWVKIYQSGDVDPASSLPQYLTVPFNCLNKHPDKSFSLSLYNQQRAGNSGEECKLISGILLNECHAYTVELVPNYQSFKGNTLRKEIVVPPAKLANRSSNMESITSVNIRSGSLVLHWLDISGCSNKLEQVSVRIFDDGKMDNQTVPTLRIPRKCFGQSGRDSLNLFSLTLPSDKDGCDITGWKSLNDCRKYTIEVESRYFSDWTGPPSVWTVFASRERQELQFASHLPKDAWLCSNADYFYCRRTGGYSNHGSYDSYCYHRYDVCRIQCEGVSVKQQGCTTNSGNCRSGYFLCDQYQCISQGNICDGKFDCLDGSDETNCNFCYELNAGTSGHLTSQLNYSSIGKIHPSRSIPVAGFTNVLVTVAADQTIWLAFEKFRTNHQVEVYDGPYSTYPLLGSFEPGSFIPPSVRSSSNSLYIRYPNYLSDEMGVEAYYFSMKSEGQQPFRQGCDGYINGKGMIRLTLGNETKRHEMLSDCVWYIEARNEHQTLLLKTSRNESKIMTYPTADINAGVFSDWNRSKKLDLMENWTSKSSQSAVLYSPGNKLLMEIPTSTVFSRFLLSEITNFSIQVFSLSPVSCSFELTGSSGTIKSPLYPNAYLHLSDCRWKIVTPTGTKIRLLFALFETQEKTDYVFVHDGPTLDSPVLLEGSGTLSTPFLVNSSTNELLVRFVSDDEVALSGFLAIFNVE